MQVCLFKYINWYPNVIDIYLFYIIQESLLKKKRKIMRNYSKNFNKNLKLQWNYGKLGFYFSKFYNNFMVEKLAITVCRVKGTLPSLIAIAIY